nr:capsular polysaccharide synthesis protein [Escherichia coli]
MLKVRDYLLSYWIHNDKQIDYFLIDYCFKLVVCNDADFSRYMNAHPLNGIDRFKLIELMNTPYNEIIKMKSINVIVGYLNYRTNIS